MMGHAWCLASFPGTHTHIHTHTTHTHTVMETITPGLYTWFMGHSQYEEMRNKGATTVFIPYLNYFSLPILVPLYHHEGLKYECYFKAPRTGETKITNLQVDYYSIRTKWYQVKRIQYFTVFRKRIPSVSGFHGEYSVRCRGLYWNTPTNSAYWSPWVTQRLKLIMFKGNLFLGGMYTLCQGVGESSLY